MIWLAVGCVLLGLFPVQIIEFISPVVRMLTGNTVVNDARQWLFLAPISAERASYSPLIFFGVVVVVLLLTFVWVRRVYHGRVRRSDPWDCGYPEQDARMQDTAAGFGQPIRQIFESFMEVERITPNPFDRQPHYHGASHDRLWTLLYRPIARLVAWASDHVGRLQHGRIQWYLVYSFATLIFLLVFTR